MALIDTSFSFIPYLPPPLEPKTIRSEVVVMRSIRQVLAIFTLQTFFTLSLVDSSVLANAFFLPKVVPMSSFSKRSNLDQMNLTYRNRGSIAKLPSRGGGQETTPLDSGKLRMTADPTIFNSAPLNSSLLIYTVANGVGFLISMLTGSHLHLDLIGTGAFALGSIPTLLSSSLTRVKLSSAAVTLWGTKLAGFLFFRALKVKHDGRLDDTLSTVSGQCELQFQYFL